MEGNEASITDKPDHSQHAGNSHGGAHVDHSGHEQMFRRRFWVCLVLSIPVLLYSPMIQEWLGFSMPGFPGSRWVTPVFSVIVFAYGGLPFLQMAAPELRNRRPGMMTLISVAIATAYLQQGRGIRPDRQEVLLGVGLTHRHHAARALDRDEVRDGRLAGSGSAGASDALRRPPSRA